MGNDFTASAQEAHKLAVARTPLSLAGLYYSQHSPDGNQGTTADYSSAVEKTRLVHVVRTPYTGIILRHMSKPTMGTVVDAHQSPMPSNPHTPSTPPSTIPESCPPRTKSTSSTGKRTFFVKNSRSQSLGGEELIGSEKCPIDDSLIQWPTGVTSSPSLRKRSPLKPLGNNNNSPTREASLAGSVFLTRRKSPEVSNSDTGVSLRSPIQHIHRKRPLKPSNNNVQAKHAAADPRSPRLFSKVSSPKVSFQKKTAFSCTLHAPLPETDEAEFTTHKVKLLSNASVNEKIARNYQPLKVNRDIGALERGYWRLLTPEDWSNETRDKFHEYLEQLITEGRAGWGTWVEPVTVVEETGPPKFLGPKFERIDTWQGPVKVRNTVYGWPKADTPKERLELRIWCWGEVVREVWLALYLGGHRFMKGLGMTWVDSVGNTVIQMK